MADIALPRGYTLDTPATPPAGYKVDAPPSSGAPGVAPGTSDDDLIKSFGFDPKVIKASPRYQANAQKYGSGLSYLLSDPKRSDWISSINNSVLGDLAMGAFDAGTGAAQLITHGLNKVGAVKDEDAAYVDLWLRLADQNYRQNIRHGGQRDIARTAGSVIAPIPGGSVSRTGRLARVAESAALGATGAAVQPVLTGEPNDYWAEKGKQVATGAVAAPIIGAAAGAVGKVAGKLANAVRGEMAPEAAAVTDAARRAGVEMTYGDVTRKPGAQKLEVSLESVPGLGMGDMRKRQHDQARGAASKALDDLKRAYQSIRAGGIDDVEKAAKDGDEYARRLLDQMRAAGNDPDRIMQTSIGLQNFRTRKQAEGLYNKVEDLVKKNNLGETSTPLDNVQEALNSVMDDAESAVIPNERMLTLLKKVARNVGNEAMPMTFSRLRRFRSDIGDLIREHQANNNALIGKKGIDYLERIRGAIEGDLQNFVDRSGVPEIQTAARAADEYYKTARVPFKDAQISWSSGTTEPDQIFQRFMMAGKGDRAQKFYDALDPKGRSAVRFEMVNRAIQEATDTGKDIFSPTKFYGYLEKLSDGYGTFFKGRDKYEMDGLKNVMSHIARAGQFAENPPTGNRLAGPAATFGLPAAGGAAYAAAGPLGAALTVGTPAAIAGMSRFLLTTEPGKRFLLASSSMTPGSPALQKLVDRILAEIPGAAGKAAGQETGRP